MDEKLSRQLENAIWDGVPEMVVRITRQTLPISMTVRELSVDLPSFNAEHRIWYNPEKRAAYISFPPLTKLAEIIEWHDALKSVEGIDSVDSCTDVEYKPQNFDRDTWVLIKRAQDVSDVLGPVAQVAGWKRGPLTNWMGGPNTLAATLASGLIGSGLGYGIGWLGEKLLKLLPEEHFESKKLRLPWAILGGLALGLPTLMWGMRGGFGKHFPFQPDKDEDRGSTLTWGVSGGSGRHFPFQPDKDEDRGGMEVIASAKPNWRQARTDLQFWLKAAGIKTGQFGVIGGFMPQQPDMSEDFTPTIAGTDFLPRLPVNAFNRLVHEDPFTPPNIRAATTGLTAAAAISSGSPIVSPADIARIGVGMGSGWLSGMAVGKALGALAGLKPESQKKLQQTGVWAGFLSSVVPIIFK